jgi:hypothetical protein
VTTWAAAHAYVAAFPTFDEGPSPAGTVYGVILLPHGTASSQDVAVSVLRAPSQGTEDRIRAVNNWASEPGIPGAFPTFMQAYGGVDWRLAGVSSGFGHAINDGRPFWTGDGRTDVLFYYPGDDHWWLGSFAGDPATLEWRLVAIHEGDT